MLRRACQQLDCVLRGKTMILEAVAVHLMLGLALLAEAIVERVGDAGHEPQLLVELRPPRASGRIRLWLVAKNRLHLSSKGISFTDHGKYFRQGANLHDDENNRFLRIFEVP